MNWLLYAILGAVLAGASPVLAKSGMHKSNSHLAAALRGTFLFFGAWFMVNLTGSEMSFSGIGSNSFLYLIFSGIATGLVWVCLLRALQLGEVVKVVPIVEGSIILDLLVGIFLFHDGVSWNKIIILIVLIAGTLMMGLKGSGRGGKTGAWLGYAIGAMALTTVTVVLDRIGITGVNSYFERLIRYGIALVLVWLVVFATRGYKGLRSMSFLDGVYLCLSGASMGGAWYCFYKAYVLGTNATVEMVERFDLVAAVVLGCVFMRERLTVRAIFGMIFMMLGFWLLLADLPIIPL
ncbi:MAG: EamA family transporter [Agathobacter sp.]|nr:EamA family transporter [Agathobacter sp.]